MQEEKLWTPTRIILAIVVAVVSLAFGICLGILSNRVWPPQNPHISEPVPQVQIYVAPPSMASPETIVFDRIENHLYG